MKLKRLLSLWFGYSRRERVASFILVTIVICIIVVSLFRVYGLISPTDSVPLDNMFLLAVDSSGIDSLIYLEEKIPELSEFDPNTATFQILCDLGLSEKQAATLINFRKSGGHFYIPEDFRKVYGISHSLQNKLIPYIVIEREKKPVVKARHTAMATTEESLYPKTRIDRDAEKIKKIELNRADSLELMTIRGIGEILGARIVKYRNLLGGYSSIMQLSEVYGLDSLELESFRRYLMIDTNLIVMINLNTASYGELLRHPYISRENTEDILLYRRVVGEINSSSDLLVNHILSRDEIEKLSPYICFSDTLGIAK